MNYAWYSSHAVNGSVALDWKKKEKREKNIVHVLFFIHFFKNHPSLEEIEQ